MGVKNLTELIKAVMRMINITSYAGRKPVGIDSGMVMRGFRYALHEDDPAFLVRAYRFFKRLHDIGVACVLVLDGPSPEWKDEEQADRAEDRERKRLVIRAAHEHLSTLREEQANFSLWKETQKDLGGQQQQFSVEEDTKFRSLDESQLTIRAATAEMAYVDALRSNIICRKEHYDQYAELARLMGVQVFQAEHEADYVLGSLGRTDQISAAFSKDGDLLCQGVPALLRGATSAIDESAGAAIEEFRLPDVLTHLELTQEQFIDLCYILGNDYCKAGLPGLGPVAAMKAIKEQPDIRQIWLSHSKRPKCAVEDNDASENAEAGTETFPDGKRKKAAPAPRKRKLKPGEVEKTPEQLLQEQAEKAQKEEVRKAKEVARLEVWNDFWPKYVFSKCKAFDTSRDAEFQITHYNIQPYDEDGLARFFAVRGIDYDSVKTRGSWMPPVQNSSQSQAAGGVAQATTAGGYDNSQDALMAAAYRMLREQRPGNGIQVTATATTTTTAPLASVAEMEERVVALPTGGSNPIMINSLDAVATEVEDRDVKALGPPGGIIVIDHLMEATPPVAVEAAVGAELAAVVAISMGDVPVIASQSPSVSAETTSESTACLPPSTHDDIPPMTAGDAVEVATLSDVTSSGSIVGSNSITNPLQQVPAPPMP